MTVIIRKPVNRLAKLIRRPGGLTVRRAMAAAEANVHSIRDRCAVAIDRTIEEIRDLNSQGHGLKNATALYRMSNSIIGTAGAIGMPHLAEAAFSLCETLDRMMNAQRWDSAPVEVHIAAMSRLRTVDGNESICKAILDGLRTLAART